MSNSNHLEGLVLVILVVTAIVFLATVIFQLLWNATMPEVFSLKQITFWQALRLLLIAGILFSGGFFRFH